MLWFNAEKGFGFLKLSDGRDAFLHMSKLKDAGHDQLPEGAQIIVRTTVSPKGPQVVEVVSVSIREAVSTPAQSPRPSAKPAPAPVSPPSEGNGVVKRYDANKGFGFIALEGEVKDVFVHATVLARCGLAGLEIGQNVSVTYSRGPKGLEANSVWIR